MRVLVIDPYRRDVFERDVPNSLEGLQNVVHGCVQYVDQLPNGDILYVNEDGIARFDAYFGLGKGDMLPGFGVVVGSFGRDNDQGPALSSVDELRSRIQYFAPLVDVTGSGIKEGERTGVAVPPSGADSGAAIVIGGHVSPQSLMLLAELRNPSLREIDVFKTGEVHVAVARQESATILTWRIGQPGDGKCLWFETPFHIGLEQAGARHLLPRETARHGRLVRMVLQDQSTRCRVSRTCAITPDASHAIEEAVVDQVVDAATDPVFEHSYQAALQRYFAGTPTLGSNF